MGINRCRHMGNFRNNGNEMRIFIDVLNFYESLLVSLCFQAYSNKIKKFIYQVFFTIIKKI